ncbi:MAG: energy-coupling factor ABC transporter ATP-binding protein [Solirubrobacterales bacterium]
MKVEVLKAEVTRAARKILDVTDLTLESGKIYAIIGPNGSGKTTLLRQIAGLDHDSSCKILYDGSTDFPKDKVAYMNQNVYMFDTSVRKNLILGIESLNFSKSEMDSIVKFSLDRVGMGGFLESKAKFLSGGEAQRIGLARILIMKKDLILLDEPSSATDIAGAELIENYIREVNKLDGRTFIFSTHNPSQAQRIAHEIIFLSSGKILEKGIPSIVLNNPENKETERFLKNWRI